MTGPRRAGSAPPKAREAAAGTPGPTSPVSPASPASRFPLALDRVAPAAGRRGAGAEPLRPQRPLAQAAADARRNAPATGVGLDGDAVRARMVARLRAEGLRCDPVLQALGRVPRHLFVDTALAAQAYEDTSLPIGLGQTISKPSVVGRMLALLRETGAAQARGHLGRVLEIGTGCGYQTALLSVLARSVVSIERLKPLHDRARENLRPWRGADIRLVHGDGRLGHPPRAPFDAIVAAAGGEALPPAWIEQLADGGRLVAPTMDPARGLQGLLVVDRHGTELHRQWLDAVHFVPLRAGVE
jgi:protein-L-isoaspartate(D-aspartate) O-methyltransferase